MSGTDTVIDLIPARVRGRLPGREPVVASQDDQPHVVIIGGGFGGLEAAKKLRRAPVRVTLVDRRNHHLFQPLLYQVATAALSPGQIARPIRAVLRRQKNTRVIMGEVSRVDLPRRRVELSDGAALDYDYLILAAGSRTSYFGNEGWRTVAPGLKTVEEALEIRRRLLLAFEAAERETDPEARKALLTFVVVGGGPTGVEMAGTMAEIARQTLPREFRRIDTRQARIILVEAGPRILPPFPEDLSASAARQLEGLGVEVMTGALVTDASESGVTLADGSHIPSAVVLWAAGVAASPLTETLGVELDRAGRVLVEPDLSIPGHPEAFAVGDLAAFTHQGPRPLPGVAPVAMQQGRAAAANITRRARGEPTKRFHYWNRGNMAIIGRSAGVAEIGRLRIRGPLAWLAWLVVHVYYLIGFANRLLVLIQWGWAYFTHERNARLITGDPMLPWHQRQRPAPAVDAGERVSIGAPPSVTQAPPDLARAAEQAADGQAE